MSSSFVLFAIILLWSLPRAKTIVWRCILELVTHSGAAEDLYNNNAFIAEADMNSFYYMVLTK